MIVIAGHIRIDAAQREKAIGAATEMMRKTQEEPGCISYCFSADLSDPGMFRIFEEWESGEALGSHMKAPHMAEFQSVVATLGVKEVSIQRYDVSSVGPLQP